MTGEWSSRKTEPLKKCIDDRTDQTCVILMTVREQGSPEMMGLLEFVRAQEMSCGHFRLHLCSGLASVAMQCIPSGATCTSQYRLRGVAQVLL